MILAFLKIYINRIMSTNNEEIVNCHTHIFTIDYVPDKFGKSILPWPFYKIFSIKLIKWYYTNFTTIGSKQFQKFIYKKNKIRFKIESLLKYTYILWIIYGIITFFVNWFLKIMLNFLRLDILLSKETKELINRYKTLARYSIHYKSQFSIYQFLKKNYPEKTKFVVLSMDMEYMEAGKPLAPYMQQIDELVAIKKRNKETIFPFIFVDPRRIAETEKLEGDNNYFNKVTSLLKANLINGIKIYPALGYYPFDKDIIKIYEFAQQYEIPITAHCARSTVFYRGKKKEEWMKHPILQYNKKEGKYEFINLPQVKNYDFTTNFTHPLNYHCLLNKKLLSEFMGVETDLSKLKICLAHFGGEDEWLKYKMDAFNNYNNNISTLSKNEYQLKQKNTLNFNNKKTIWWNSSWLSIIYDLLIEYENVYADISFILSYEELFPTLKYILQDEKVRYKILFGTDYYLVSQKNLDKDLYQKLRSYLGEEIFTLIAYTNANRFLQTRL